MSHVPRPHRAARGRRIDHSTRIVPRHRPLTLSLLSLLLVAVSQSALATSLFLRAAKRLLRRPARLTAHSDTRPFHVRATLHPNRPSAPACLLHRNMSATPAAAAASSPAAAAGDEKSSRFPPWLGPHGESNLKVRNSLVHDPKIAQQKVPFIPAKGNFVGWYTCGPTVYDSAHLGHARWSEDEGLRR